MPEPLETLEGAEPKLLLLWLDARVICLLGEKRPPGHLRMKTQAWAGGKAPCRYDVTAVVGAVGHRASGCGLSGLGPEDAQCGLF